MGPLIDKRYSENYFMPGRITAEGGNILVNGGVLSGSGFENGCQKAIAGLQTIWALYSAKHFSSILYLIKYKTLEEAIQIQMEHLRAYQFPSWHNMREADGSECIRKHCGITPTWILVSSSAESGGAFGEKKQEVVARKWVWCMEAYMRRQTNTVNWGNNLHLWLRGIKFDLS